MGAQYPTHCTLTQTHQPTHTAPCTTHAALRTAPHTGPPHAAQGSSVQSPPKPPQCAWGRLVVRWKAAVGQRVRRGPPFWPCICPSPAGTTPSPIVDSCPHWQTDCVDGTFVVPQNPTPKSFRNRFIRRHRTVAYFRGREGTEAARRKRLDRARPLSRPQVSVTGGRERGAEWQPGLLRLTHPHTLPPTSEKLSLGRK